MIGVEQNVPSLQDLDDSYQISILVAFLTGFVMVLAYIVCEDAPCHSSPTHETVFLLLVALLMLAIICVAYYLVWESLDEDERIADTVVLFVYLMQFFLTTSRTKMKAFAGPQPAIRTKECEYLGRSILMVMKDVDKPLDMFPTMSSGSETPPIVRNMLPMFMLLLVVRVSLHPQGLLGHVTTGLVGLGVFLITLSWVLILFRYLCYTRRRKRRLVNLLWRMLDEKRARYVLPMLHCPRLLSQISNSSIIGDFCEKASKQLGASGKAVLIDALAKNGLGWGLSTRNKMRQRVLVDILKSADGHQLTQLKNYLDMSGNIFNLVYIFSKLSASNRDRFQWHVDSIFKEVGSCHRCKILSDIDDTLQSSGGHFPAGSDRSWPRGWFYPGVLAFYRNLDRYYLSPNHVVQRLILMNKDSCKSGLPPESPLPRLSCQPSVSRRGGDQASPIRNACQKEMPQIQKEIDLVNPSNAALNYADIKSVAWQAQMAELGNCRTSNLCEHKTHNDNVLVKLHRVDECNLVFLSARPHVHKDATEQASYRVFERLVHARRLHVTPSLLPGSLWPGFQACLCAKFTRRAWHAAALRKFESFLTYARLYPEYEFIFIGDNGQGDVYAAELMMDREHSAGVGVKACFVHEVVPLEDTFTSMAKPSPEAWAAKKIFFFKTYVGAALAAVEVGLLNAANLAEVVSEALEDYHLAYHVQSRTLNKSIYLNKTTQVQPEPAHSMDAVRSDKSLQVSGSAWLQLCADIERANKVLQKHGMLKIEVQPPTEALPSTFSSGGRDSIASHSGWDVDGISSEDGDDFAALHPQSAINTEKKPLNASEGQLPVYECAVEIPVCEPRPQDEKQELHPPDQSVTMSTTASDVGSQPPPRSAAALVATQSVQAPATSADSRGLHPNPQSSILKAELSTENADTVRSTAGPSAHPCSDLEGRGMVQVMPDS